MLARSIRLESIRGSLGCWTAGERGGKRARAPPDGSYRKYYRITRRGLVEVDNRARSTLSSTHKPELMPGARRFVYAGSYTAALWGGWTAGERGGKRARAPPTARIANTTASRAVGSWKWTIGLETRLAPHISRN